MTHYLTFLIVLAWSLVLRAEKLPVPPDTALAGPLAVIKEVYGEEHSNAKTNEQLQVLAKKLFSNASNADNPIERYALLRVARGIANQACDGQTAFQIIDEMDATYRVDVVAMKASVLHSLAKKARLPADRKSIVEQALALVDQALARDDFELSGKLAEMALSEARKARDGEFLRHVVARNKEIEELGRAFLDVKAAAVKLEGSPTDPEANLAVGRYRCLVKGDWDNGLPMLALGSDPVLRALAAKGLERLADPTEQVKLADGWWNLAEKQKGITKQKLQDYAADWYELALPQLSGLVKARVERRIGQLEANRTRMPGTPQARREIALFNGKDLNGWQFMPISYSKSKINKTWVADARRNVLVSLGGDDHNNLATVGLHSDFELSLQWRFRPGGEVGPNGSGIVVRVNGLNSNSHDPKGIEVDLRPNKDIKAGIGTGCLIASSTPAQSHWGETDGEQRRQLGWMREPQLKGGAEWNECVITCKGEHLVVEMNGLVVNRAWGIPISKGRIVLRNQKTAVEFRDIRLVDLAPSE